MSTSSWVRDLLRPKKRSRSKSPGLSMHSGSTSTVPANNTQQSRRNSNKRHMTDRNHRDNRKSRAAYHNPHSSHASTGGSTTTSPPEIQTQELPDVRRHGFRPLPVSYKPPPKKKMSYRQRRRQFQRYYQAHKNDVGNVRNAAAVDDATTSPHNNNERRTNVSSNASTSSSHLTPTASQHTALLPPPNVHLLQELQSHVSFDSVLPAVLLGVCSWANVMEFAQQKVQVDALTTSPLLQNILAAYQQREQDYQEYIRIKDHKHHDLKDRFHRYHQSVQQQQKEWEQQMRQMQQQQRREEQQQQQQQAILPPARYQQSIAPQQQRRKEQVVSGQSGGRQEHPQQQAILPPARHQEQSAATKHFAAQNTAPEKQPTARPQQLNAPPRHFAAAHQKPPTSQPQRQHQQALQQERNERTSTASETSRGAKKKTVQDERPQQQQQQALPLQQERNEPTSTAQDSLLAAKKNVQDDPSMEEEAPVENDPSMEEEAPIQNDRRRSPQPTDDPSMEEEAPIPSDRRHSPQPIGDSNPDQPMEAKEDNDTGDSSPDKVQSQDERHQPVEEEEDHYTGKLSPDKAQSQGEQNQPIEAEEDNDNGDSSPEKVQSQDERHQPMEEEEEEDDYIGDSQLPSASMPTTIFFSSLEKESPEKHPAPPAAQPSQEDNTSEQPAQKSTPVDPRPSSPKPSAPKESTSTTPKAGDEKRQMNSLERDEPTSQKSYLSYLSPSSSVDEQPKPKASSTNESRPSETSADNENRQRTPERSKTQANPFASGRSSSDTNAENARMAVDRNKPTSLDTPDRVESQGSPTRVVPPPETSTESDVKDDDDATVIVPRREQRKKSSSLNTASRTSAFHPIEPFKSNSRRGGGIDNKQPSMVHRPRPSRPTTYLDMDDLNNTQITTRSEVLLSQAPAGIEKSRRVTASPHVLQKHQVAAKSSHPEERRSDIRQERPKKSTRLWVSNEPARDFVRAEEVPKAPPKSDEASKAPPKPAPIFNPYAKGASSRMKPDASKENTSGDFVCQEVGKTPASTLNQWHTAANRNTREQARKSLDDDSMFDYSQEDNRNEPDYKYEEVVRKKSEREALNGYECPDCAAFVNEVMRGKGKEVFNRAELMQCSRHRGRHTPPATPQSFWELSFVDERRKREAK